MSEILPIASGLRLPILMFISARALSAPINIHCDHQDVMAVRDLGWIQIFSESAQEVYDNAFIALRLAEKTRLPAMVIMDGFTTSHSVENLEVLDTAAVRKFIGEYKPENYLLDTDNPVTFGPVGLPNSYFEFKRAQIEAMDGVIGEYIEICRNYVEVSGRDYDIFEGYNLDDAEKVIVVAGSTAGTAKVVVDELRERGEKVGLLKIKLFRPFPYGEIKKALEGKKRVAVLDRSVSFGSVAPLYGEIVNSTFRDDVQSCIFGLGGREIFGEDIARVFEEMGDRGDRERKVVNYIGLK